MIESITTALDTVIGWFGTCLNAVITSNGALHDLLPVFALGICVTVVFAIVGLLKKFTWGA